MTDTRKIHTGTYVFGNQKTNTSFGGAYGVINLPDYSSEIGIFVNDACENKTEVFDDAKLYRFNIDELESIFSAIGRLINDLRKLESLSRKDLLRDEAYHRD